MKSLIGKRVDLDNRNNFMNIFKGIVISFALTLILLLLFSIILTYTNINENTIAPVIIVITVVSILIGSSISTIKIRKNGIVNGGIIGLFYILSLYIISSLVQTGFSLNVYSIVMIILSIIAGMIGRNSGSKYEKIIDKTIPI